MTYDDIDFVDFVKRLPDTERVLMFMLMDGYELKEVAELLKYDVDYLRRVREAVRTKWENL